MFTKNGNILKINGDWLKPSSYPEPPEPEPYPFEEVTIGTQIWSKPNLDIDDGGEGIHKVDNVTAMGYNLGTQYYYTWDAAVRVCSNIVGWHLPTMDDWTVYVGVKDKPHYGYWYTFSMESRRYFPSGAYYDVGWRDSEFNTMPNARYDMMYKFMNSADYYVDKGTYGKPSYLELIPNWWIASAVSTAGYEIWSVTVESNMEFGAKYGHSAEYKPVRLLKDGSIIQPRT